MSREDEEIDLDGYFTDRAREAKRKEDKAKRAAQEVYVKGGKLTVEGRGAIGTFLSQALVPDKGCRLDISALTEAFETWVGADTRGFNIEAALGEETEKTIFAKSPVWSRFETWSYVDANLDPNMSHDSLASIDDRIFIGCDYNHGEGICARFRDSLGAEGFDPTEDESSAVEYLVDELLPRQGVHMLVAKPETLKTWLAYRLAIDVSKGQPALGRFATKAGRVMIVDFEVGSKEVKRRLRMLGADERVFYRSFPPFDLNDDRFWIELKKICPRFVVIDGLGSGQEGGFGELDSRFAEPLGRAARFAERFDCTFLVLHHSGKAASMADVESLFRGTGAIRSKVDSAYFFRRLRPGPNGEVRSEVIPVKSRKGTSAPKFAIELTDARGLSLFEAATEPEAESEQAPEPTDAERVLAFVDGAPGCSARAVARELEMGNGRVAEMLEELERAGKVRKESGGKGLPNAYFMISEKS